MKSHRHVRKELYDYLQGGLSGRDHKAIEEHLAQCQDCRLELDAIRDSAAILRQHARKPHEVRPAFYWQQFAAKVELKIEREREHEQPGSIVGQLLETFLIHRRPFSIGFASALMMMMIVFGVWSVWFKSPSPDRSVAERPRVESVPMESGSVQNTSLDLRAQDYLEQSKVLLIGLLNTDTKNLKTSAPLLLREREISRKLVSESATLTTSLNDPSQRRLRELISDLQLILVQIANLSNEQEVPGVEIIKGGIEHNAILFKINLEQIQRTTRTAEKTGGTAKKTT